MKCSTAFLVQKNNLNELIDFCKVLVVIEVKYDYDKNMVHANKHKQSFAL